MAAVKDGLAEETLRDLASLAAWGKHAQNVGSAPVDTFCLQLKADNIFYGHQYI